MIKAAVILAFVTATNASLFWAAVINFLCGLILLAVAS